MKKLLFASIFFILTLSSRTELSASQAQPQNTFKNDYVAQQLVNQLNANDVTFKIAFEQILAQYLTTPMPPEHATLLGMSIHHLLGIYKHYEYVYSIINTYLSNPDVIIHQDVFQVLAKNILIQSTHSFGMRVYKENVSANLMTIEELRMIKKIFNAILEKTAQKALLVNLIFPVIETYLAPEDGFESLQPATGNEIRLNDLAFLSLLESLINSLPEQTNEHIEMYMHRIAQLFIFNPGKQTEESIAQLEKIIDAGILSPKFLLNAYEQSKHKRDRKITAFLGQAIKKPKKNLLDVQVQAVSSILQNNANKHLSEFEISFAANYLLGVLENGIEQSEEQIYQRVLTITMKPNGFQEEKQDGQAQAQNIPHANELEEVKEQIQHGSHYAFGKKELSYIHTASEESLKNLFQKQLTYNAQAMRNSTYFQWAKHVTLELMQTWQAYDFIIAEMQEKKIIVETLDAIIGAVVLLVAHQRPIEPQVGKIHTRFITKDEFAKIMTISKLILDQGLAFKRTYYKVLVSVGNFVHQENNPQKLCDKVVMMQLPWLQDFAFLGLYEWFNNQAPLYYGAKGYNQDFLHYLETETIPVSKKRFFEIKKSYQEILPYLLFNTEDKNKLASSLTEFINYEMFSPKTLCDSYLKYCAKNSKKPSPRILNVCNAPPQRPEVLESAQRNHEIHEITRALSQLSVASAKKTGMDGAQTAPAQNNKAHKEAQPKQAAAQTLQLDTKEAREAADRRAQEFDKEPVATKVPPKKKKNKNAKNPPAATQPQAPTQAGPAPHKQRAEEEAQKKALKEAKKAETLEGQQKALEKKRAQQAACDEEARQKQAQEAAQQKEITTQNRAAAKERRKARKAEQAEKNNAAAIAPAAAEPVANASNESDDVKEVTATLEQLELDKPDETKAEKIEQPETLSPEEISKGMRTKEITFEILKGILCTATDRGAMDLMVSLFNTPIIHNAIQPSTRNIISCPFPQDDFRHVYNAPLDGDGNRALHLAFLRGHLTFAHAFMLRFPTVDPFIENGRHETAPQLLLQLMKKNKHVFTDFPVDITQKTKIQRKELITMLSDNWHNAGSTEEILVGIQLIENFARQAIIITPRFKNANDTEPYSIYYLLGQFMKAPNLLD